MSPKRLKAAASRLFGRGRQQRAAARYWELCLQETAEPKWRVRHAEACRRLGLFPQAVASYRVAAELYSALGYDSRALAAVRWALELAPEDEGLSRHAAMLEARIRAWSSRKKGQLEPPEALRFEVVPPGAPPEVPRATTLESFRVAVEDEDDEAPRVDGTGEVEVRRISSRALAVRTSAGRWLVVRSARPLQLDLLEEDSPHCEPTLENDLPPEPSRH